MFSSRNLFSLFIPFDSTSIFSSAKSFSASNEADFSELTARRSQREVIIKQRSTNTRDDILNFIFMLKICSTAPPPVGTRFGGFHLINL